MFTLHPHQWAITRAYLALSDYRFRQYLTEKDVQEVERITTDLISEFKKDDNFIITHDNNIIVSCTIEYNVVSETDHVDWDSIIVKLIP